MSDLSKQLAVYAVTDRSWLNGRRLVDDIRKVLDGGVTILQLREKELPVDEFLAEAREIKALCDSYGVPLIINDEVGIAKELGVGAHVGQHDESLAEARAELGPDAIIGVSCENVAQAIAAEKGGADYLGVEAVFPTSTKTDAAFVDSRELAAICAAVKIPVVAIGGISLDNLMTLGGSGIVGVAVVSALFAAADPFAATKRMAEEVDKMLKVPVLKRKGAIIDLDGTLIDSIPYWDRLGYDYLESKGVTPRSDLKAQLDSMEIPSGAAYIKATYGLKEDVPTICRELIAGIESVYREKAPLLPRAKEMLEDLRKEGVRMTLFTATAKPLAVAALQRTGIDGFFDSVISTMDLGIEKSSAEAYYSVLGRMGTVLSETTVYDDAEYALDGAKKAGFKVVKCS
jgi:thiamine-phosphate pyrophosphorylase